MRCQCAIGPAPTASAASPELREAPVCKTVERARQGIASFIVSLSDEDTPAEIVA